MQWPNLTLLRLLCVATDCLVLGTRLGENWGIDISPTLSDDRRYTARSVALAGGSTRDSIKLSACLLLIDFLVYILLYIRLMLLINTYCRMDSCL